MTRYFCTLFDSGYLLKGVVMLRSLHANCVDASIFVLCMDEPCKHILAQLALPGVVCISLQEVENEKLLAAKKNRNVAEYCWTLSSNFTEWVMNSYDQVNLLTYVDADLMFFSSVEPLFEEIDSSSIAIIEHRFSPQLKHLEVNGRFCVEWVTFRRDAEGQECLRSWREQCLEWCFARLEEGRMGDQKYLDAWPRLYPSTHILQHIGAGLAPWNYANYSVSKNEAGNITVDGKLLVFYHFHQFQLLKNGGFDRLSASYMREGVPPDTVYRSYEQQLATVIAEVRSCVPDFYCGMRSTAYVNSRRWVHLFLPSPLKDFLKRIVSY